MSINREQYSAVYGGERDLPQECKAAPIVSLQRRSEYSYRRLCLYVLRAVMIKHRDVGLLFHPGATIVLHRVCFIAM